MNYKFIIVSVCLIIVVTIILILASGSVSWQGHQTVVTNTESIVVTETNGMEYMTNIAAAVETNITSQTN